jgi:uncharacterized protein (TIGR02147 family)
MTSGTLTYRTFIRDVFAERTKANPSLSLRGLARLCGVSPGHLSRVINGEKQLSLDSAMKISSALSLSDTETNYFRDLVLLETTRSERVKTEVLQRLGKNGNRYRPASLELEQFKIISDWHHFAILNLMNTVGFKSDDRWIAKRLALSLMEVKVALERLESLGFIEKTGKAYALCEVPNFTTSDDISSAALRNFHTQMLTKAAESLKQDVSDREFNGLTVSFDPAEMPRAKKLIRDFVTRMNVELEKKPGKEVYQLNLQFFKLTK